MLFEFHSIERIVHGGCGLTFHYYILSLIWNLRKTSSAAVDCLEEHDWISSLVFCRGLRLIMHAAKLEGCEIERGVHPDSRVSFNVPGFNLIAVGYNLLSRQSHPLYLQAKCSQVWKLSNPLNWSQTKSTFLPSWEMNSFNVIRMKLVICDRKNALELTLRSRLSEQAHLTTCSTELTLKSSENWARSDRSKPYLRIAPCLSNRAFQIMIRLE